MRHEPSGSLPPVQPTADRRCPSCRAVKPLDDFSAASPSTPAGCCTPCRRHSAEVARRRQERTLRQVARRAEASYRALLAQHAKQGSGGDAA
jgi:hypothetical protein